MKSSRIRLSALFLLTFFSAKSQDLIEGTWKVNYQATIVLMTSTQRVQYDSLSSEAQQEMRGYLDGQQFRFAATGDFQVNAGDIQQEGTWEKTDGQLILTFSSGGVTSQRIESLDSEKMVLRIVSDPSSTALIHRIHLDRISN